MTLHRTFFVLALLAGCNRPTASVPAAATDASAKPSLTATAKPTPEFARPVTPRTDAKPQPEPDDSDIGVIARRVHAAATDAKALALLLLAADDTKVTYAQLKKNAQRYKGSPWVFTGRVVEITESEGLTVARLALDYYANNIVFVTAFGESPFVDGDVVDVLGIVTGTESFTSQAGWNITLPSVMAAPLMKRGELAKLRKVIKDAQRKAPEAKTAP